MEGDTASLRQAAPQWSLAGDKQLLGMLQKIHQKIVTKCEEANVKLDAMVDALDNANIDLQNVNNKFMALNNTQFVESRVYDDDVDMLTEGNTVKTEVPEVAVESEISKLKRSLQRLEQMHEPVHILDSDSSDDEDDGRIILKPKEIYSHRPLPYIIGTQAWKNKWHAGLLPEESDSDSSTSKRDNIPAEEYSESEPETAPTDKLANRTISSSSSMDSEVAPHSQTTIQRAVQPARQADIAAELARRLGGQPVQLPVSEPVTIEAPEPTTKKVYRVEKPAPSNIFSDEPPPLDEDQSYKSDYSEDDDIFAELNKKPSNTNKDHNRVANDLFGGFNEKVVDDLFGDRQYQDTDIGNVVDYEDVKPIPSIIEKIPVVGDKPNTSTEKPMPQTKPIEINKETEGTVKKPVGGISLFGSNKGAESIGAAILKRNQRKSSTSYEEKTDVKENIHEVLDDVKNKEAPVNKMIEDLFNKPVKKPTKKGIKWEDPKIEENKPVKDKIDLFSDNLFDDIDDIFTTNIVTKPKDDRSRKSIFDDDDDLFADITFTESEKISNKSGTKSNLDGAGDELFSDNVKTFTIADQIATNTLSTYEENSGIDEINRGENEKMLKDKILVQAEIVIKTDKNMFAKVSEDNLSLDIKTEYDIVQSQDSYSKNITEVINRNIEDKSSSVNKDMNNLFLNINADRENILSNESERKKGINIGIPNSQIQSTSFFDVEESDDLFSEKTKLIKQHNNSKSVEDDKKEIGYNDHTESLKSKSDLEYINIDKDDHLGMGDTIAETRQNKSNQSTQLNRNFVEPHSTFLRDSTIPVEVNIPQVKSVIQESETMQNKDIPAMHGQDKILDQNKKTSSSVSNDADNILIKPTSGTLLEDVSDITPKNTLGAKLLILEAEKPNLYNDLPPAFQKPLEPKKSKNVNALFDDDSDDEALFFKKNEGISDEKPDIDYSSDRFSIFHDEPPEIDIDFSQKSSKSRLSCLSELPDEEGFAMPSKVQNILKSDCVGYKEDEPRQNIDLTKENKLSSELDITKLIEDDSTASNKTQLLSIAKVVEGQEEDYQNYNITEDKYVSEGHISNDVPDVDIENLADNKFLDQLEDYEPKKVIGKLKPMCFSINVSSLLPGASLKRSKINEEIDGQIVSTKSNEELNIHNHEKSETKVVKSASFEGDPESKVLDNKLSKQRAKIQIKRRPPSRKARLEAVRKSGIDFSSDSTDNSSSFDETPYKEIVNEVKAVDIVSTTTIREKKSTIRETSKESTTNLIEESIHKVKAHSSASIQEDIRTNITTPDIKSKVVYILNDEDIFTNVNAVIEETDESRGKNKAEVMKVDESANNDFYLSGSNTPTSGNINEKKYSSEIREKDKTEKEKSFNTVKSIFDDLSDDDKELFKSSNAPVHKGYLFDSDSDSELFAKGKRESKLVAEIKKKDNVKGSLFGDESDDENDLFAVKAVKLSGNGRQIPKSKEIAPQTEPVFEDPLSMFEDDS